MVELLCCLFDGLLVGLLSCPLAKCVVVFVGWLVSWIIDLFVDWVFGACVQFGLLVCLFVAFYLHVSLVGLFVDLLGGLLAGLLVGLSVGVLAGLWVARWSVVLLLLVYIYIPGAAS